MCYEKAHKRFPRRQSDEIFSSDLLFGRQLCSHLDLLCPDLNSKVRQKQNTQKQTRDYHAQNVVSRWMIRSLQRITDKDHPGSLE